MCDSGVSVRVPGRGAVIALQREEVDVAPDRVRSGLDPALQLIQRVRDEAHRFAITRHRGRRSKRMRETSLMEIPGIGPTRARILLRRFGSISGLAAADPKEVEDAVGPASARAVRDYLDAVRPAGEPVGASEGPSEGGRVRSA